MLGRNEDRKSSPSHELLERQRRRASFSSWFMLGLGVTLLIAGVCLKLGDASGELESGPAGLLLKKLHGPIPALIWTSTILFCFRQFRRDRERAKELEKQQNRIRIINRYPDSRMSAEDVIRLLEDGAGPKPPSEARPHDGIVIRVRPVEREIKTIKPTTRRGLPESVKTEKPYEK
jgi:hypothetical protein